MYDFACDWLENLEEFLQTIFSDESSCQNSTSNPTAWHFRFPSEKWDKRFVNLKNHVKANISIMVWGMIWKGGRSELIIMERDEDAPRRGYTARSYQKALTEGLLPHYDDFRHFQQDNAKIHVCKSSEAWLQSHQISWIEWPAHSPDLNPIEHVWALLKRNIRTMFPDLWELKKNELDIEDFKVKLRAAWWAVKQGDIDRLIETLPRRLKALKKARGWYTKY